MGKYTFAQTISAITNKPASKYHKLYKQLQQYAKKSKSKGSINITYHYSKYDIHKKGRIYANDDIGLQRFSRIVRGALAHNNYYDIDMVNSHPSLLYELCNKLAINCPELKKYVKNRKHYLDQLCMFNTVTLKEAKETYISVMNGGSNMYNRIWFKPKHLISFKNEIQDIADRLRAYYSQTLKEIKDKPRDSKKFSETGSFISTICCRIENEICNQP